MYINLHAKPFSDISLGAYYKSKGWIPDRVEVLGEHIFALCRIGATGQYVVISVLGGILENTEIYDSYSQAVAQYYKSQDCAEDVWEDFLSKA